MEQAQIDKLKACGYELYNTIGLAQQELQGIVKQLNDAQQDINIAPIPIKEEEPPKA
jgi:5-bromo-4-chloroindolyl phosphate hydrolysis protein